MLTIRRLSMGAGFKYLMDSVAVGDGAADQSSALTRYYAESGTPPGRFMGAGLDALGGSGRLSAGDEVTGEHLYRMLGGCVDPITGDGLGRAANRQPPSLEERVERRMGRVGGGLTPDELAARRAEIELEERRRAHTFRPPVAGFDLTFSPPKSVSTAWAVADEGTKAIIYECHQRAITYTLSYAEEHVFHSRSGTNGVRQEEVEGIVAAAFTHYDSRSGDPQLHDHVVVWNRAKSRSDGQWRTLDSRGLYKQVVTLSEIHQGVLSDLLTAAMGVGWGETATRNGMRKHEIVGVPDSLIREFSQRREMMDRREDELVAKFLATRGREPTPVERRTIAQQANLDTRPEKVHRSLVQMTGEWRERAVDHVGDDPVAWVSTLAGRNDLPALRTDDLSDDMLAEVARWAEHRVAERHSTFSRANLLAELHRQLHGVVFASPDDRVAVAERAADLALGSSVMVTPPEMLHVPERYRRADGSSAFRPADHHLYTTAALLDAEARLFEAARRMGGPAVTVGAVASVAETSLPGRDYAMSTDQALAVEKIATSGRRLDVLVGPAGTGKSTTMAGLRAVWEAEHGAGSVVGLAPSAASAEALAVELGIDTDNTAKWLHEHRHTARRAEEAAELRRRLEAPHAPHGLQDRLAKLDAHLHQWTFRPGQLVIVDEASLAGTFALEELVVAVQEAGAKLLLVGDPYQLGAVDAGGMFRSLVRDRDDIAPELTEVRRFKEGWEKAASVELRVGSLAAIDAYESHDRISEGDRTELVDRLYRAWREDIERGRSSLMVAGDAATVAELNGRARADRVAAGIVAADGLVVADGQVAGVGDEVVTRENKRLLATGKRWVKNGDRWSVTATNDDGSMTVKRVGGAGQVVLPASYVSEHVELSYATTAHRGQGRTVDTAHAMVSPTTTREVLYVAATRGRESNRLYVDTHYDPDPDTSHDGTSEPQTARSVLAGVLGREGSEVGAHDQIKATWDAAEGIPQLHAEYLTIARVAQQERWDALLDRSGLTDVELDAVRESDAYGPLVAAFRDAEARSLNVEAAFPPLVAARSLDGAQDVASVLHGRVDRWIETAGSKRQAATDLIAGLVPRAKGVADEDLARALRERDEAMERRAMTLAEQAVERRPTWVRKLGRPPAEPAARTVWMREVRVVAAYRDRWNLTDSNPVDRREQAHTIEQIGHQKRAQAAAERALAISRQDCQQQAQPAGADLVSVTVERNGVEL